MIKSGFILAEVNITHDLRSSDVDGWFNPELHAELKRQEREEDDYMDRFC